MRPGLSICNPRQIKLTYLSPVEYEPHPSQADLVAFLKGVGMPRCESLLVHVGVVGALQVLDEYLRALDGDTGVATGDPALIPTMVGQVDLGEDATDGIRSSDDELGPTGWEGQQGVRALHH